MRENNFWNGAGVFKTVILTAAFVVFAVYTPRFTNNYSMMIMNVALINFISALGLSVMLGMGGQLSFAAVSFMGLGGYFVANLTNGRLGIAWEPVPVLILAVLFAAISACISGAVLFRLRGTYFTFATIGLVQVTWSIYLNYRPLCGGPDGISGIPVISFLAWLPETTTIGFTSCLVLPLPRECWLNAYAGRGLGVPWLPSATTKSRLRLSG